MAERLGAERQRLAAWGYAQAVLSAWWTVEDEMGDGGESLAVAALFAPLL